MKTLLVCLALSAPIATPLFAGHNNPWSSETDTIQEQYHDEKLQQSVDTPGEDEMNGVMDRNARGKLDADVQEADASGGRDASGGKKR